MPPQLSATQRVAKARSQPAPERTARLDDGDGDPGATYVEGVARIFDRDVSPTPRRSCSERQSGARLARTQTYGQLTC